MSALLELLELVWVGVKWMVRVIVGILELIDLSAMSADFVHWMRKKGRRLSKGLRKRLGGRSPGE
ncbi:hypothetical protein C8P63_12119 [Melghirimyces profundicolus]|uniref:Uncharacterized protein n=1 Tax=Melghirimyces profundicolus TaxID=1242148 RepID=A0A2T6BGF3_9BACL|nr:hypothetical protein [Melghirimyces profundicolus]PTX55139.1 hypothetical protein C8P63_12119 [Melghirimyces profundicolus]